MAGLPSILRGAFELALALCVLGGPRPTAAQALRVYDVQPHASYLYAVTHKSGLLSFLGHEHAILPIVWSGQLCLADPAPAGARGSVVIQTASLVIDSDSARALAGLGSGPGEEDRREIQRKMLGPENLDAERFPEITLELSAREAQAANRLIATGTLFIRGVSRGVEFPVTIEAGEGGVMRLAGQLRIRQRDFGLRPESVAGVVRVSNEVDLYFSLAAVPTPAECGGHPE